MRVQILRHFGADARFEPAELPDPVAGPGEVLVRIAATSINPIELKLRRFGGDVAPALPAVLGCDLSGEVVAVGPGVDRLAVGDAVFGCVGGVNGMPGTYATMAAVDARLVARAPRQIPLRDAAALPLAGLTASFALQRAQLSPGQSALILGATGGVGHLAVQMARALGATVHAGVRTAAKIATALSLGADAAFSTDGEDPGQYAARVTAGEGFDLVVDCSVGIDLAQLLEATAQGGHVVTLVTQRANDLRQFSARGLSMHAVFVPGPLLTGRGREAFAPQLERIADWIDTGLVRPNIDRERFSLDRIEDGHAKLHSGSADGKILVVCGD